VRLADPGRSDEEQIRVPLDEAGRRQFRDLGLRNLGIEGPVEVVEELDSFDSGASHQELNSLLFSQFILFGQESF
jgi:hypothetical protein